jgi:hypothetical protein
MRNILLSALRHGRFDRVEEHGGHREAGLLGDFLEAGRAGDVYFREEITDNI